MLIHFPAVIEIHIASHIGITLRLELWSCNTLCHFCGGSLNIVLGFHCFTLPSFCPQHPRLVFPPTLPIILDVITHYNVTHKGKRLLCLENDLPRTNSSLCLLGKRKCLESLSELSLSQRMLQYLHHYCLHTTHYSTEIPFIRYFCRTARKWLLLQFWK